MRKLGGGGRSKSELHRISVIHRFHPSPCAESLGYRGDGLTKQIRIPSCVRPPSFLTFSPLPNFRSFSPKVWVTESGFDLVRIFAFLRFHPLPPPSKLSSPCAESLRRWRDGGTKKDGKEKRKNSAEALVHIRSENTILRTSDFGLRTSDFGLRTSDFGLRTSGFGG